VIDDADDDRTTNEERETDRSTVATESLGVSIPDEHVGAFVAEVFEDPERSTTWAAAIDATIDDAARDAWDGLTPTEQATELLGMAIEFDDRAIEAFEAISVPDADDPGKTGGRRDPEQPGGPGDPDHPGDRGDPEQPEPPGEMAPPSSRGKRNRNVDVRERFETAARCRRNADALRNAIAHAYADDYLDDEALVAAVEANDFDTTRVARREQLVASVTETYDFDVRPYGGTLLHDSDDRSTEEGDGPRSDAW
jgi:hypothetical protein